MGWLHPLPFGVLLAIHRGEELP
uniref:Uncharacterized protein n=1 Tax=Arundo donax TaxID=35708 RepID=A0A0A9BE36_ARUDO